MAAVWVLRSTLLRRDENFGNEVATRVTRYEKAFIKTTSWAIKSKIFAIIKRNGHLPLTPHFCSSYPLFSKKLHKVSEPKQTAMCGDATNWDEDAYRESILKEREIRTRTVFRTVWGPSQNPNPDTIVVASSDGSLASYSISSCISKLVSHLIFTVSHFNRICSELNFIYLFFFNWSFFGLQQLGFSNTKAQQ